MSEKQKVSMVSLGCPKNLVDAEVMLGFLAGKDMRSPPTRRMPISSSSTPAPSSRRPSRRAWTRSSTWPTESTTAAADPDRDRLPASALSGRAGPGAAGGGHLHRHRRLPPHCRDHRRKDGALPNSFVTSAIPNFIYDETLPASSPPGLFRYLKIAEGCSNCCSYCVIPSLRGAYRSRPLEALVRSPATGGWRSQGIKPDRPGHHQLRSDLEGRSTLET